ncbi:MAG: BrnT family toxin [Chloroflexi bacterium]|nr:BrnT family toxin [Chloroflexota bacterium]
MDLVDSLSGARGFEWDEHNSEKIWERHRVSPSESEQVFFNRPLVVAGDVKHSEQGNGLYALGHADDGRLLFVVFTVRGTNIRVASARDMSRKEREEYQSHG